MSEDFKLHDRVRYTPGYKGYFAAEIVGFEGYRVLIEFSSGLQITCWPDELERA